MEDETSGDTWLVLGGGAETRHEVVDLDGANPDVGNELQVNACADGGGERRVAARKNGVVRERAAGNRARANGLVRAAKQNMSERGDASRKRDLRTEQIGVLVRVAGAVAERRTVVAAEIAGDTEERQEAIGGGEFPAVEVLIVRGNRRWADGLQRTDRTGADIRLLYGDRRAQIRVAAEDHDFVLSKEWRSAGTESKEKKDSRKPGHEGPPSGFRDLRLQMRCEKRGLCDRLGAGEQFKWQQTHTPLTCNILDNRRTSAHCSARQLPVAPGKARWSRPWTNKKTCLSNWNSRSSAIA
jgi:hypothetical protein